MTFIAVSALSAVTLWLAVCGGLTVAGLKRRRWGTPGGGRAVVAGTCGAFGLLVPVGTAGVAIGTGMGPEMQYPLLLAMCVSAGALWAVSTAALASALRAAVGAAARANGAGR